MNRSKKKHRISKRKPHPTAIISQTTQCISYLSKKLLTSTKPSLITNITIAHFKFLNAAFTTKKKWQCATPPSYFVRVRSPQHNKNRRRKIPFHSPLLSWYPNELSPRHVSLTNTNIHRARIIIQLISRVTTITLLDTEDKNTLTTQTHSVQKELGKPASSRSASFFVHGSSVYGEQVSFPLCPSFQPDHVVGEGEGGGRSRGATHLALSLFPPSSFDGPVFDESVIGNRGCGPFTENAKQKAELRNSRNVCLWAQVKIKVFFFSSSRE